MIIKAKPLSSFLFSCISFFLGLLIKMRFNKMTIYPVAVNPHHSYLLMCNHFSFWDGPLAFYLVNKVMRGETGMKKLYIMSLKKQMEKNRWLRYIGSFSVEPGKRSIGESFDYAAEILSGQGNLLLFYPQGKLESCHIRHIQFEEGIAEIVPKIKGDCQLIWSSNIFEYFESVKPSVYFNMLHCGTNHEFNFDLLQTTVNAHHLEAVRKTIRYTTSPLA